MTCCRSSSSNLLLFCSVSTHCWLECTASFRNSETWIHQIGRLLCIVSFCLDLLTSSSHRRHVTETSCLPLLAKRASRVCQSTSVKMMSILRHFGSTPLHSSHQVHEYTASMPGMTKDDVKFEHGDSGEIIIYLPSTAIANELSSVKCAFWFCSNGRNDACTGNFERGSGNATRRRKTT